MSDIGFGVRISALPPEAIQPFVGTEQAVLEFGARQESTLAGLRAASKTAVPFPGVVSKFSAAEALSGLPGNSVDVVFCQRVLEYLPEPTDPLREFKRVLRPGGTLLVIALYDEAFRDPLSHGTGGHFFSWNVQTLGNLLIDCGYEFREGFVKSRPAGGSDVWVIGQLAGNAGGIANTV